MGLRGVLRQEGRCPAGLQQCPDCRNSSFLSREAGISMPAAMASTEGFIIPAISRCGRGGKVPAPRHQSEGLPCAPAGSLRQALRHKRPADGMRWKPPAGRTLNSGRAAVQARPRSASRQTAAIGRPGNQQAATEASREQVHSRVALLAQARLAGRLPRYEFTSKYMQSGCWNTKALTLASGSIMSPSVSVTPISAGSSSLNSPRWSSRFGQAAYPKL